MNLALIFSLVAVLILGSVLFAFMTFGRKKTSLNIELYRKKWLEIENLLSRADENTYHIAIIRADSLLDMALKELGYSGKTMAERLVSSKNLYSHNNALWAAHKLRNKIVHEHDTALSYKLTLQALSAFKRALKEIGAV